jgi:hypothetical protein
VNFYKSTLAFAGVIQSFRRHYRRQFAFSIPWCNDRADNSDDLYRTKTLPHEDGTLSFLEVVAFGKGCQTAS